MTRLRRKLAVAAVASVASLLVCELVVRLVVNVPVVPFLRNWDPDLGLRFKKSQSATISYPEFTMRWSTNSRGFRGPEPPPSTDGCIVVLGDSFSEGWGVNDGEEYASLLRRALDERYGAGAVPVVNASMSKSGNSRWIKLLRGDLAGYHPRLVLFQACWNDSLDNIAESMFELAGIRTFPDAAGTVTELVETTGRPKPFGRSVQPLIEAIPGLQSSHLFALLRTVARDEGAIELHTEDDVPDGRIRQKNAELLGRPWLYDGDYLMFAMIEHSLAICRRRGWPAALMCVRIGGLRLEELRHICARFDTPLLDIRNRVERPELYYAVDGHWNAAGHRFVADLVLDELLAPDSEHLEGLVPKDR